MSKTKVITFSIWFIFFCVILSVPLLDMQNKEAHLFYGLLMLGITFPSGYLFAMLIAFIGYTIDTCCGISLPTNEVMLIPTWFGFVLAGYFQWFIFLPWAFKKIKNKLDTN